MSHSPTNPSVNTSAAHVGIDSLFLWVRCTDEGVSALQTNLQGSIPVLAFLPRPGVVNLGTSTSLLLGTPCIADSTAPAILGSILVSDFGSGVANLTLGPPPDYASPIVASCPTDQDPIQFVPMTVGFASGGGAPDTSGAEFGCGMFSEPPTSTLPLGSLPYDWSTDFGAPAQGGKGANNWVYAMRKMTTQANRTLVAGRFTTVGALAAPSLARLTISRVQGAIQTSWDVPPQISQLPALPLGRTYLALEEGPDGSIAVGSNSVTGFIQPLMFLPPTGPPRGENFSPGLPVVEVFAIEHWGPNGRYLAAGYSESGLPPADFEYHGLAQYNPDASPVNRWEYFGYPIVGNNVHYWLDDDLQGIDEIGFAMLEVDAPGTPKHQSLFLGGRFNWIFGVNWQTGADLTFEAKNCAVLNATTGEFLGAQNIPGSVYTITQATETSALDGGRYVYVAGNFGHVDGFPGMENAAVMKVDLTQQFPINYTRVGLGGGPPYAGPMKNGTTLAARIYKLAASREHLYAIGEFDRVLTQAGGMMQTAKGFARYSFQTGLWESLGDQAIGTGNQVPYAGEIDWPTILVGGDFATVGGTISSTYIGAAAFDQGVVAAPDVQQMSPRLAPFSLEPPSPNPSRAGTSLGFEIPRTSHVRLAIHDVSGRVVSVLVNETHSAGEYIATWDGKDALGRRAAAGIYFARLSVGGSEVSRKLALLN